MNNEELINGIGNIDDDIIAITAISRKKRSKKPLIIKLTAMAACVCLILSAVFFLPPPKEAEGGGSLIAPMTTLALEAEYPTMPQYPNDALAEENWDDYNAAMNEWRSYNREVCGYPTQAQLHGVDKFLVNTAAAFLKTNNGENALYSPMNVYFALSMLAETAEGETRSQILNVLGFDSLESLREAVNVIWKANYRDDGSVKSLFANSVWLNNQLEYNSEVLNIFKDKYYASSYSGTMGSPEYDEALKLWINTQTGDLLSESVKNLEGFNPDTVFALASTVYFKASWSDKFISTYNTNEIFHSAKGDVECEFMNQSRSDTYYRGENFGAISKSMRNYGRMYFILPDEGTTPENLISDGDVLEFIVSPGENTEQSHPLINMKVPKFDVTADLSLIDGLKEIGVIDAFDPDKADLSTITDISSYVNRVDHSARVTIDEEGCEAAAFTLIAADAGSSLPKDEIDFYLDRPFIFVITSPINTPLFIGIVNNP